MHSRAPLSARFSLGCRLSCSILKLLLHMSRTQIFIFLGIISALFLLVDALIYNAVALAFNISSPALLLGLKLGLVFFSGSFILANIWGRYSYTWLTRIYATATAVWIGASFYLFIASVVYGACAFFGYAQSVVGVPLLAVAAVTSIYGLLHARRITIKEVSVSLPHLPAAWKGRKAVWVSDLHLGQIYGARFTSRVVQKINAQKPDVVFIGGDLFDGTTAPDLVKLSEPLKEMSARLGTFYVTGNHEEFDDNTKFIEAVKAAGARVLMDEMVEVDGLQLVGVDYHNASNREQFAGILSKLNLDIHTPSILLKHEPNDLSVAEQAGISLQISGHTHRAQMWPLEYIARMSYKGFVYGLNKLGPMQVYTSSGVGSWGPPLRVGTDSEVVVFIFQ